MNNLSKERIQKMFEDMGLDSEKDRKRFEDITPQPTEDSEQEYYFIRTDSNTCAEEEDCTHAELAPTIK